MRVSGAARAGQDEPSRHLTRRKGIGYLYLLDAVGIVRHVAVRSGVSDCSARPSNSATAPHARSPMSPGARPHDRLLVGRFQTQWTLFAGTRWKSPFLQ
jgi:hypothetical protein